MFTVVMVPHKRAFVTLGHKSLPPACSGVDHKGIVQSAPTALVARTLPSALVDRCWTMPPISRPG